MNIKPFGEWLHDKRKESYMSQRSLADAIGINHTYLSKIENGKMPPPGEESLKRIASALGVDAETVYRQAGRVPECVVSAFANGMSDESYRLFRIACGAADFDYRKLRSDQFRKWQAAQKEATP